VASAASAVKFPPADQESVSGPLLAEPWNSSGTASAGTLLA